MEETIHKIGRRKTAVARVYLKKGKGKITVNKKDSSVYFPTPTLQFKINQPLVMTGNEKKFDININVYGGGATGQAEAVRLALSRAMCELNEENREIFMENGGKKFGYIPCLNDRDDHILLLTSLLENELHGWV